MAPKISNVVIVIKQNFTDDGDLVIVLFNRNYTACKRLKKYTDGIALLSNNPSYKSMYLSLFIISTKPIDIIERVVELRAKC